MNEEPGRGPESGLDILLLQARELGDEGDFAGMAERLREELDTYPDEPSLLCWLAVAERELGMEGVAYERFKLALALDPEDPHILATAGNALSHFDDPEAETALRAAALLGPDLPLARWMYGAYLAREGFALEARKELDEAKALDPEEPGIAYESGVAYALAGQLDAAVEEFARAAEMAPEDGWFRVVLGLALVEADRVDEALAELDAAARYAPEDVEAQLAAALVHAGVGNEDEAWEFLERARFPAQGTDLLSVEEVEERVQDSPEAADRFLRNTLSPTAFRERLQARP
ncbi:MAG TPA: tetratricopeptide repeat protein [Longimicrobiales bacterium]|nr:tetratricopeptide repeat protein [Longimicrobiales bacterium]